MKVVITAEMPGPAFLASRKSLVDRVEKLEAELSEAEEAIESMKEQIGMRDDRIQRLRDHVGDEGMGEFK